MKIMKQRAAQNFKNATKANAAETRWEKFVAAGPPPPPVPDQQIRSACAAPTPPDGWSSSIDVSVGDLFLPFSDEVHFGERVGLIGPNGTGKTHLLDALAGGDHPRPWHRRIRSAHLGGHVHPGQRSCRLPRPHVHRHRSRAPLRRGEGDEGPRPLRPGVQRPPGAPDRCRVGRRRASRSCASNSRATTCCCSTSPPTTSTSSRRKRSSRALDGFQGTVVAVSHDRTFLATLDRFVMITDDGEVLLVARLRDRPPGSPRSRPTRRAEAGEITMPRISGLRISGLKLSGPRCAAPLRRRRDPSGRPPPGRPSVDRRPQERGLRRGPCRAR